MIHEKVSGNLSNPNGLGEWFGFCAVYFLVLGLQTRRGLLRACAWAAAVTCLYVVGLTVSRGAILATAIASLFAIQHILKRGFVPVFVLIVFAWVVLESGLFGHALSLYSLRGTEETGRFLVWPVAFERFLSSPLVGVGAADVATYVPERKGHVTPHNTLIYFGLASGVFPLILFLAFWIQMACRHLSRNEIFEESVFRKPFLVYAFVVSMTGDLSFMAPWGLLALSPGIRSVLRFQASPLVKGKRRMDEPVDVPGPTGWVAR